MHGMVLYGSCDTSVGIRSLGVVVWTCFLGWACELRVYSEFWGVEHDDVSRTQRCLMRLQLSDDKEAHATRHEACDRDARRL